MQKLIFLVAFTFYIQTTFCQQGGLEFILEDSIDYREQILKVGIKDVENSFLVFRNNTILNDSYEPAIHGSTAVDARSGLVLMGNIQKDNDFGNAPIISMTSFVDNGLGVDNGGYSFSDNRHYFRIRSYDSAFRRSKFLFEIDHLGRIGIGTSEPRSKLEVTDGDVYISDANKGVIMTAPNGSCHRMTISNDGQPLFSAVPCPTL